MPHRRFAVIALLALSVTIAAIAVPRAFAEPKRAKTYVVKFHADWCGSCKTMGPVMTDLGNKLDGEPILFVELDLTNERTSRQARFLARALGLEKVFNKHAPKTGFILVIDARTGAVKSKLTKLDGFKKMVAAIRR